MFVSDLYKEQDAVLDKYKRWRSQDIPEPEGFPTPREVLRDIETLSSIAEQINEIILTQDDCDDTYDDGHTDGYDEGHSEGHAAGYDKGYEEGFRDGKLEGGK